ncbi:FtsK/SpoIIIE domain-containing protein, partial [Actinotalea sp. JY-7885]|uniref:FtsK/SpoIIIE domain-containing protein n=1 Tax=Actinotalea sp. JY-7885 TaxID=2758576 RepID=UPI002107FC93
RLAARWAVDEGAAAGVPDLVALADLCGSPSPAGVAATWRGVAAASPLRSLTAPLGVDAAGAFDVDLLAHGPHALVAGTTGSGKSELLQAWVLGLALRYPPTHLAMVLVDFKAGAALVACAGLPHVVGMVTDLDAGTAARALSGLRSEMRRRKAAFASAGVADLEDLRARGAAPPRLLVVVDEFRALADDLPDFVPGLVDLAAQGRSLGLHLVLATQRPAGAVTAQMRANLALRLCLRVTDAADSQDVVEVPDAAAIAVGTPGRALVRRAGAVVPVQTAWAAHPAGAWQAPARP